MCERRESGDEEKDVDEEENEMTIEEEEGVEEEEEQGTNCLRSLDLSQRGVKQSQKQAKMRKNQMFPFLYLLLSQLLLLWMLKTLKTSLRLPLWMEMQKKCEKRQVETMMALLCL